MSEYEVTKRNVVTNRTGAGSDHPNKDYYHSEYTTVHKEPHKVEKHLPHQISDVQKKANEALEALKHNEQVSLLRKKLRDSNNRLYNMMDHYADYAYRETRKKAPFLNLPPEQPIVFSMALAALAIGLMLLPLIAGLTYWNHHKTLHHYAYTLNDVDLDALKKYWKDSHYLDHASHAASQLSENVKQLPRHSKVVGELGMLYRNWHKYNKKSKMYKILDQLSDPVYHRVHRLGSDLGERLSLAPAHKKPVFFPFLLPLLAGLGGLYAFLKYGGGFLAQAKRKQIHVPDNTVMVFGLPAGTHVPEVSPFVLKLETWLRMVKMPYQIDFGGIPSSEGKNPWIYYNGHEVPDSQMAIEFLKRHAGAEDLDRELSPKEKTVSQALRVFTESRIYWPLNLFRFVYGSLNELLDECWLPPFQKFFMWPATITLFKRKVWKARAADTGLFDKGPAFVYETGIKDIQALSDFLGNKQYMMGEKPTEVDAAVFGMLGEIYWTFPKDHILRTKFDTDWPNLAAFLNRIKDRYWPDWEERTRTGKAVSSHLKR